MMANGYLLRVCENRYVSLRAMADGSLLRTAAFNGIDHLVVPIVTAVGDNVWWPANAPTPELVPASVLAAHAFSRNNRPIVMGHPKSGGDYCSANDPKILQEYAFGQMFASSFENGRIIVEAWLDPVRAAAVGPDAVSVIDRLRAGEQVEVSEGDFVVTVAESGEVNGKKYGARWVSAVSDHLAMLPAGDVGACDNKMGCGGPRVSVLRSNIGIVGSVGTNPIVHQVGYEIGNPSLRFAGGKEVNMKESLFKRMAAKIKSAMSNNNLRWKLYKAISALEPGVEYVDDEDVAAGTVRYVVMICFGDSWASNSEMQFHYYQRTFTADTAGLVTVNDDRVELVYDETKAWVVLPAAEAEEIDEAEPEIAVTVAEDGTVTDCKCHDVHNTNKGESNMKPNEAQKNLAGKLIAATASPFEESDRATLEGMSEAKLGSLVSKFADAATTTTTTTTTPAAMPEPVAVVVSTPVAPLTASASAVVPQPGQRILTEAEYASLKTAADAFQAVQSARRTHLVLSLKTACGNAFTEADLNALDTPVLEKLAASHHIDMPASADFSLRGIPQSTLVTSEADKLAKHKPKDTWALALAAKNKREGRGSDDKAN